MVFVYGTLMPGQSRWPLIRQSVARVEQATVGGALYDTGHGYPAARFDEAGKIEGWRLTLHPANRQQALTTIDGIEGDLYERVMVTTTDGDEAVSYQWRGGTDDMERLGGRWVTGP